MTLCGFGVSNWHRLLRIHILLTWVTSLTWLVVTGSSEAQQRTHLDPKDQAAYWCRSGIASDGLKNTAEVEALVTQVAGSRCLKALRVLKALYQVKEIDGLSERALQQLLNSLEYDKIAKAHKPWAAKVLVRALSTQESKNEKALRWLRGYISSDSSQVPNKNKSIVVEAIGEMEIHELLELLVDQLTTSTVKRGKDASKLRARVAKAIARMQKAAKKYRRSILDLLMDHPHEVPISLQKEVLEIVDSWQDKNTLRRLVTAVHSWLKFEDITRRSDIAQKAFEIAEIYDWQDDKDYRRSTENQLVDLLLEGDNFGQVIVANRAAALLERGLSEDFKLTQDNLNRLVDVLVEGNGTKAVERLVRHQGDATHSHRLINEVILNNSLTDGQRNRAAKALGPYISKEDLVKIITLAKQDNVKTKSFAASLWRRLAYGIKHGEVFVEDIDTIAKYNDNLRRDMLIAAYWHKPKHLEDIVGVAKQGSKPERAGAELLELRYGLVDGTTRNFMPLLESENFTGEVARRAIADLFTSSDKAGKFIPTERECELLEKLNVCEKLGFMRTDELISAYWNKPENLGDLIVEAKKGSGLEQAGVQLLELRYHLTQDINHDLTPLLEAQNSTGNKARKAVADLFTNHDQNGMLIPTEKECRLLEMLDVCRDRSTMRTAKLISAYWHKPKNLEEVITEAKEGSEPEQAGATLLELRYRLAPDTRHDLTPLLRAQNSTGNKARIAVADLFTFHNQNGRLTPSKKECELLEKLEYCNEATIIETLKNMFRSLTEGFDWMYLTVILAFLLFILSRLFPLSIHRLDLFLNGLFSGTPNSFWRRFRRRWGGPIFANEKVLRAVTEDWRKRLAQASIEHRIKKHPCAAHDSLVLACEGDFNEPSIEHAGEWVAQTRGGLEINGYAGVGKSALSVWIARQAFADENDLTVSLRIEVCDALGDHTRNADRWLLEAINHRLSGLLESRLLPPADIVKALLRSGRIVVFFDHVDPLYKSFGDCLRELVEMKLLNRYVVVSRRTLLRSPATCKVEVKPIPRELWSKFVDAFTLSENDHAITDVEQSIERLASDDNVAIPAFLLCECLRHSKTSGSGINGQREIEKKIAQKYLQFALRPLDPEDQRLLRRWVKDTATRFVSVSQQRSDVYELRGDAMAKAENLAEQCVCVESLASFPDDDRRRPRYHSRLMAEMWAEGDDAQEELLSA